MTIFLPIWKRLTLRLISLALCVCFGAQELSYAEPFSFSTIHHPLSALQDNPHVFEAPLEYCSLKEIHSATKTSADPSFGGQGQANKPLIIHIQDAHSNISGQENLAKALEQIIRKYYGNDIPITIFSEGGRGDCSLTGLKKIASQEVWQKIAKSYLLQGKLHGEEYLNLVSNHPIQILGIEDMELYLKSLENYAKLKDQRERTLEYLKQIQAAVEKLKRRLYPRELVEYEELSSTSLRGGAKGDDEAISTAKIAALATLARNDKIDLLSFPVFQRLLAIQQREKEIDFNLANLEQAALIEEIRQKSGGSEIPRLAALARDDPKNIINFLGHFQNILNIAKEKNLELSKYAELLKYEEYLRQFSTLDLDQLFDELERLEDVVFLSSLTTQDSRLIRSIDRYLKLLQTAYKIQMSTQGFQTFLANEPDFLTPAYQGFINRKLAEFGYFEDLVSYQNFFEEGKKNLIAFYDSVSDRDEAFVRNIQRTMEGNSAGDAGGESRRRQPACRQAGTPPNRVAVLITGGYHTQNLKKLLKEKGYSYAVLTPKVTEETDQAKYERRLLAPLKRQTKIVEVSSDSKVRKTNSEGLREALHWLAPLQTPNLDPELKALMQQRINELIGIIFDAKVEDIRQKNPGIARRELMHAAEKEVMSVFIEKGVNIETEEDFEKGTLTIIHFLDSPAPLGRRLAGATIDKSAKRFGMLDSMRERALTASDIITAARPATEHGGSSPTASAQLAATTEKSVADSLSNAPQPSNTSSQAALGAPASATGTSADMRQRPSGGRLALVIDINPLKAEFGGSAQAIGDFLNAKRSELRSRIQTHSQDYTDIGKEFAALYAFMFEEALEEVLVQHGIPSREDFDKRFLAVFTGSIARGEASPDSDIDYFILSLSKSAGEIQLAKDISQSVDRQLAGMGGAMLQIDNRLKEQFEVYSVGRLLEVLASDEAQAILRIHEMNDEPRTVAQSTSVLRTSFLDVAFLRADPAAQEKFAASVGDTLQKSHFADLLSAEVREHSLSRIQPLLGFGRDKASFKRNLAEPFRAAFRLTKLSKGLWHVDTYGALLDSIDFSGPDRAKIRTAYDNLLKLTARLLASEAAETRSSGLARGLLIKIIRDYKPKLQSARMAGETDYSGKNTGPERWSTINPFNLLVEVLFNRSVTADMTISAVGGCIWMWTILYFLGGYMKRLVRSLSRDINNRPSPLARSTLDRSDEDFSTLTASWPASLRAAISRIGTSSSIRNFIRWLRLIFRRDTLDSWRIPRQSAKQLGRDPYLGQDSSPDRLSLGRRLRLRGAQAQRTLESASHRNRVSRAGFEDSRLYASQSSYPLVLSPERKYNILSREHQVLPSAIRTPANTRLPSGARMAESKLKDESLKLKVKANGPFNFHRSTLNLDDGARLAELEFQPGYAASGIDEKFSVVQKTRPAKDERDFVGLGEHRVNPEVPGTAFVIAKPDGGFRKYSVDFGFGAGGNSAQRSFEEGLHVQSAPQRFGQDGVRGAGVDNRQMRLAPSFGLLEFYSPPNSVNEESIFGKISPEIESAPDLKRDGRRYELRPLRKGEADEKIWESPDAGGPAVKPASAKNRRTGRAGWQTPPTVPDIALPDRRSEQTPNRNPAELALGKEPSFSSFSASERQNLTHNPGFVKAPLPSSLPGRQAGAARLAASTETFLIFIDIVMAIPAFAASTFWHEATHFIAASIFGLNPKFPGFFKGIDYDSKRATPLQNLAVVASAPLSSLMMSLITVGIIVYARGLPNGFFLMAFDSWFAFWSLIEFCLSITPDVNAEGVLSDGWLARHYWQQIGSEKNIQPKGDQPAANKDSSTFGARLSQNQPFKPTARPAPPGRSARENPERVSVSARIAELRMPDRNHGDGTKVFISGGQMPEVERLHRGQVQSVIGEKTVTSAQLLGPVEMSSVDAHNSQGNLKESIHNRVAMGESSEDLRPVPKDLKGPSRVLNETLAHGFDQKQSVANLGQHRDGSSALDFTGSQTVKQIGRRRLGAHKVFEKNIGVDEESLSGREIGEERHSLAEQRVVVDQYFGLPARESKGPARSAHGVFGTNNQSNTSMLPQTKLLDRPQNAMFVYRLNSLGHSSTPSQEDSTLSASLQVLGAHSLTAARLADKGYQGPIERLAVDAQSLTARAPDLSDISQSLWEASQQKDLPQLYLSLAKVWTRLKDYEPGSKEIVPSLLRLIMGAENILTDLAERLDGPLPNEFENPNRRMAFMTVRRLDAVLSNDYEHIKERVDQFKNSLSSGGPDYFHIRYYRANLLFEHPVDIRKNYPRHNFLKAFEALKKMTQTQMHREYHELVSIKLQDYVEIIEAALKRFETEIEFDWRDSLFYLLAAQENINCATKHLFIFDKGNKQEAKKEKKAFYAVETAMYAVVDSLDRFRTNSDSKTLPKVSMDELAAIERKLSEWEAFVSDHSSLYSPGNIDFLIGPDGSLTVAKENVLAAMAVVSAARPAKESDISMSRALIWGSVAVLSSGALSAGLYYNGFSIYISAIPIVATMIITGVLYDFTIWRKKSRLRKTTPPDVGPEKGAADSDGSFDHKSLQQILGSLADTQRRSKSLLGGTWDEANLKLYVGNPDDTYAGFYAIEDGDEVHRSKIQDSVWMFRDHSSVAARLARPNSKGWSYWGRRQKAVRDRDARRERLDKTLDQCKTAFEEFDRLIGGPKQDTDVSWEELKKREEDLRLLEEALRTIDRNRLREYIQKDLVHRLARTRSALGTVYLKQANIQRGRNKFEDAAKLYGLSIHWQDKTIQLRPESEVSHGQKLSALINYLLLLLRETQAIRPSEDFAAMSTYYRDLRDRMPLPHVEVLALIDNTQADLRNVKERLRKTQQSSGARMAHIAKPALSFEHHYVHFGDRALIGKMRSLQQPSFPYGHPWRRSLKRALQDNHTLAVAAMKDGGVLGFIVYERREDEYRILRWDENPNFKGYGVLSSLVQELKLKVKAQRMHRILVHPDMNPQGEWSVFFEKEGFKNVNLIERKLKAYYGQVMIWESSQEPGVSVDPVPQVISPRSLGSLTIGTLRHEDTPALLNFLFSRKLLPGTSRVYEDDLYRQIVNRDILHWVAKVDGQMVSVMSFRPERSRDFIEIYQLKFLPVKSEDPKAKYKVAGAIIEKLIQDYGPSGEFRFLVYPINEYESAAFMQFLKQHMHFNVRTTAEGIFTDGVKAYQMVRSMEEGARLASEQARGKWGEGRGRTKPERENKNAAAFRGPQGLAGIDEISGAHLQGVQEFPQRRTVRPDESAPESGRFNPFKYFRRQRKEFQERIHPISFYRPWLMLRVHDTDPALREIRLSHEERNGHASDYLKRDLRDAFRTYTFPGKFVIFSSHLFPLLSFLSFGARLAAEQPVIAKPQSLGFGITEGVLQDAKQRIELIKQMIRERKVSQPKAAMHSSMFFSRVQVLLPSRRSKRFRNKSFQYVRVGGNKGPKAILLWTSLKAVGGLLSEKSFPYFLFVPVKQDQVELYTEKGLVRTYPAGTVVSFNQDAEFEVQKPRPKQLPHDRVNATRLAAVQDSSSDPHAVYEDISRALVSEGILEGDNLDKNAARLAAKTPADRSVAAASPERSRGARLARLREKNKGEEGPGREVLAVFENRVGYGNFYNRDIRLNGGDVAFNVFQPLQLFVDTLQTLAKVTEFTSKFFYKYAKFLLTGSFGDSGFFRRFGHGGSLPKELSTFKVISSAARLARKADRGSWRVDSRNTSDLRPTNYDLPSTTRFSGARMASSLLGEDLKQAILKTIADQDKKRAIEGRLTNQILDAMIFWNSVGALRTSKGSIFPFGDFTTDKENEILDAADIFLNGSSGTTKMDQWFETFMRPALSHIAKELRDGATVSHAELTSETSLLTKTMRLLDLNFSFPAAHDPRQRYNYSTFHGRFLGGILNLILCSHGLLLDAKEGQLITSPILQQFVAASPDGHQMPVYVVEDRHEAYGIGESMGDFIVLRSEPHASTKNDIERSLEVWHEYGQTGTIPSIARTPSRWAMARFYGGSKNEDDAWQKLRKFSLVEELAHHDARTLTGVDPCDVAGQNESLALAMLQVQEVRFRERLLRAAGSPYPNDPYRRSEKEVVAAAIFEVEGRLKKIWYGTEFTEDPVFAVEHIQTPTVLIAGAEDPVYVESRKIIESLIDETIRQIEANLLAEKIVRPELILQLQKDSLKAYLEHFRPGPYAIRRAAELGVEIPSSPTSTAGGSSGARMAGISLPYEGGVAAAGSRGGQHVQGSNPSVPPNGGTPPLRKGRKYDGAEELPNRFPQTFGTRLAFNRRDLLKVAAGLGVVFGLAAGQENQPSLQEPVPFPDAPVPPEALSPMAQGIIREIQNDLRGFFDRYVSVSEDQKVFPKAVSGEEYLRAYEDLRVRIAAQTANAVHEMAEKGWINQAQARGLLIQRTPQELVQNSYGILSWYFARWGYLYYQNDSYKSEGLPVPAYEIRRVREVQPMEKDIRIGNDRKSVSFKLYRLEPSITDGPSKRGLKEVEPPLEALTGTPRVILREDVMDIWAERAVNTYHRVNLKVEWEEPLGEITRRLYQKAYSRAGIGTGMSDETLRGILRNMILDMALAHEPYHVYDAGTVAAADESGRLALYDEARAIVGSVMAEPTIVWFNTARSFDKALDYEKDRYYDRGQGKALVYIRNRLLHWFHETKQARFTEFPSASDEELLGFYEKLQRELIAGDNAFLEEFKLEETLWQQLATNRWGVILGGTILGALAAVGVVTKLRRRTGPNNPTAGSKPRAPDGARMAISKQALEAAVTILINRAQEDKQVEPNVIYLNYAQASQLSEGVLNERTLRRHARKRKGILFEVNLALSDFLNDRITLPPGSEALSQAIRYFQTMKVRQIIVQAGRRGKPRLDTYKAARQIAIGLLNGHVRYLRPVRLTYAAAKRLAGGIHSWDDVVRQFQQIMEMTEPGPGASEETRKLWEAVRKLRSWGQSEIEIDKANAARRIDVEQAVVRIILKMTETKTFREFLNYKEASDFAGGSPIAAALSFSEATVLEFNQTSKRILEMPEPAPGMAQEIFDLWQAVQDFKRKGGFSQLLIDSAQNHAARAAHGARMAENGERNNWVEAQGSRAKGQIHPPEGQSLLAIPAILNRLQNKGSNLSLTASTLITPFGLRGAARKRLDPLTAKGGRLAETHSGTAEEILGESQTGIGAHRDLDEFLEGVSADRGFHGFGNLGDEVFFPTLLAHARRHILEDVELSFPPKIRLYFGRLDLALTERTVVIGMSLWHSLLPLFWRHPLWRFGNINRDNPQPRVGQDGAYQMNGTSAYMTQDQHARSARVIRILLNNFSMQNSLFYLAKKNVLFASFFLGMETDFVVVLANAFLQMIDRHQNTSPSIPQPLGLSSITPFSVRLAEAGTSSVILRSPKATEESRARSFVAAGAATQDDAFPNGAAELPERFLQTFGARLSTQVLNQRDVEEITRSKDSPDLIRLKQLTFHLKDKKDLTAFQFRNKNTILKFEWVEGSLEAVFSYFDRKDQKLVEFARHAFSEQDIEEGRETSKPDQNLAKIAKTILKSPEIEAQREEERITRQAIRTFNELSAFMDDAKDTVHVINVDAFASKGYPEILVLKATKLLNRRVLTHTYVLFTSSDAELERALNRSLPAIPWSPDIKVMYHADVEDTQRNSGVLEAALQQKLSTFGRPEALKLDLGFTPFKTRRAERVIMPFEAEIVFSDIIARLKLQEIDLRTLQVLKPLISYLKIQTGVSLAEDTHKLSLLQNYDPKQYFLYLELAIQAITKLDIDGFITYTRMALEAIGAAA